MKNEPRPDFAGRIHNVTVNVGREAVLECPVNHLGHYKVGWLKAKDQTILALHHRVITHNNRFDVDHDENRIWKLKIRSVQESDAGCYMCQINTEIMKKQVGCIDVLSKLLTYFQKNPYLLKLFYFQSPQKLMT